MFGRVIKWSTIACVLGYSGIDIQSGNFDIVISNAKSEVKIVACAAEISYDKNLISDILSGDYVKIEIDLKNGENNATAWGCDLTYGYVKANGYFS